MIIDVQPTSALLRKYIVGFNMFEERKDFNLKYFVFPQFGSTLELFQNVRITSHSKEIRLTPITPVNKEDVYAMEVFGKYTEPVLFNYDSYVNAFAINFTALGINYFFDKSYKKIAPKNFQIIFDGKWEHFAKELFSISSFNKRVEFAETFLESIFNNINLVEIEKAINVILTNTTINIYELAKLCGMSSRNLLRKFNEYVGCSPAVYKRIARFRNAIDLNKWKDQKLNCTDVCYTNNFFDTSHLRKEFLKLTHQNPKEFFKSVSAVGNRQFPYKLVK